MTGASAIADSDGVHQHQYLKHGATSAVFDNEVYEDLTYRPLGREKCCQQCGRSTDSVDTTEQEDDTMSHPYVSGPPKPIGLYDPSYERDACGVGMIVNVKSRPSHAIVRDALDILERLAHRGACGCDPKTGDGAGILLGLPDSFFRRVLRQEIGVDLPQQGKYAAGLCFLSKNWEERQRVKVWIESVVAEHGARVICWRTAPTDNSMLGPGSKSHEPHMEQIFITADSNSMMHTGHPAIQMPAGAGQHLDAKAFQTLLYVIRKKLAHGSVRHGPPPGRLFVCSLSDKIFVYKGQLTPEQLPHYFTDLNQEDFVSHMGLVHSRFSTNTFPSWERAQPMRNIAHNGEINTVKGNSNWMASRQGKLRAVGETAAAAILDSNIAAIGPVVEPGVSDSGAMDNAIELLVASGCPIEQALCMLIPESWQNHGSMDPQRRAMYEFFSNKMEPWDGPALVAFTDGNKIGATLDRNGLRPGRIIVTSDDRVILSSEVGVLPSLPDSQVVSKSRLIPGEIFMIDLVAGRIVADTEIKQHLASRLPYAQWLAAHKIELSAVVAAQERAGHRRNEKIRNDADDTSIEVPTGKTSELERLKLFGYSHELVSMIVGPMGTEAMEMLGSMGNDQALTFLSTKPRHVWDYFQQMFAQVTNPPIDPIRESIVMTLTCPIGPETNLLDSRPQDCARIALPHPVLRPAEFYALTHLPNQKAWRPKFIDMSFPLSEGPQGLKRAVARISDEATAAVKAGTALVVLTDRAVGKDRVPVSSLLATGTVHHRLIKEGLRTATGLVVEAGDASEVHHMCLLTGFGADAIYPWGAYTAIRKFQVDTQNPNKTNQASIPFVKLVNNYAKAAEKGILKVMAKMGISTLASYKGAQIFEAVGIGKDVIDLSFVGSASRIGGVSWDVFGADLIEFHREAFPPASIRTALIQSDLLKNNGDYHWRSGQRGEQHLNHPDAIAKLQEAARYNSRKAYKQYADISNALATKCTLRGQFELRKDLQPIDIKEVEPVQNIVKRFASGAMSYGSISIEAHSTLAIAMNQLGAKSNTGEGGEHLSRYETLPNGESARSAIKQVASGRFGVTIHYLSNSDEIQIKMAQGAKPGEGGELPGYKVVGEIAKTRMTTAGVGLISPPPHHDIYSIEDLAQLIYDLKNANPKARISVKLVSEAGVGVVAAGVTKGKADHILISGHDGGTGACYGAGTYLRMFDGSVKSVEMIGEGDRLMGDDNTVRVVRSTTSGATDVLYQITAASELVAPAQDPILVTAEHILVFVVSPNPRLYYGNDRKCWVIDTYVLADNALAHRTIRLKHLKSKDHDRAAAEVELQAYTKVGLWMPTVVEYLSAGDRIKQIVKFTRVLQPVVFESTAAVTTAQSVLGALSQLQMSTLCYIIGCWLGDGTTVSGRLTVGDDQPEMLEGLKQCGEAMGWDVLSVYNKEATAYRVTYQSDRHRGVKNDPSPLVAVLKAFNMLGGKHIPASLLAAPVEYRWKLLAGLMDTDGALYKDKGYYSFVQGEVHLQLVADTVRLAQSLALRVSEIRERATTARGKTFVAYTITVSGAIDNVPCVIPSKVYEPPQAGEGVIKDKQRFAVKVEPVVGMHQYYGFTLGGPNQRFLLADYTVAHNSKWTGIKHAGLPWELGLAETHQTLVLNGLRSRVILQTDGQLKTGLDVIKGALLGAEEFCMATAPLIALGCIMMRKCHLNTCPVGIATQDPELRAMFAGQPEHVVNFLWMIAEEVREHMASLGIRKFNDLIGRVDLMQPSKDMNQKAMTLDLSCMLVPAQQLNPSSKAYNTEPNEVPLDDTLDAKIIQKYQTHIDEGKKLKANFRIRNTDRTVGTLLSHTITLRHGVNGLPEHTMHLRFRGSAGQSFGAWLCKGLTLELNGDANDYVGKGLSGGSLVIYPPKDSLYKAEDNVIVGNVCLYGATGGTAFFRGRALQRFCVRNSGADVVVEGIGDHGCEYMTGGTCVVLGPTGRNFAAGMSGGVAYIYDPEQRFPPNCNRGLVQLEKMVDPDDVADLEHLLEEHRQQTGSAIADRLLWSWPDSTKHFIKVIPTEYKQVMMKAKAKAKEAAKLKEAQPQTSDKQQHPVAVELPQKEGKEQQSVGYGESESKSHEKNVSRDTERFNTGVEQAPTSEPKMESQIDSFGGKQRQGVKTNKTRAHMPVSQDLSFEDMYSAGPAPVVHQAQPAVEQIRDQYDGDWLAAARRTEAIVRQEEMEQRLAQLTLGKSTARPVQMQAVSATSAVSDTDSAASSDIEAVSPVAESACGCGKTGGCGSSAAPSSPLSMNATAGGGAGGLGGSGKPGQDIEEAGPMDKLKGGKHHRPSVVDKPQKKRGFIEYERGALKYRPAKERLQNFDEIYGERDEKQLTTQAARCMDCGVPFCHDSDTHGCPLGNKIPEWNQLVYEGKWKAALDRLLDTNNFPEFTGRICPAPCEGSCVLGIIESPVTIKNIEVSIIDHAWDQGWIVAKPPAERTGRRVAIIGSGPAGLAAADQLNKVGHHVTVFERADRIGGLCMYGVPNMKLDKSTVIDRRVNIMKEEGIEFVVNAHVGADEKYNPTRLLKEYDAIVMAIGATKPRDLPIEGRQFKGVHFAMDFLYASTQSLLDNGQSKGGADHIDAKGKNVIVIGGGDTGNDCLGTALRMGCKSVVNFELLPQPPETRGPGNPWPQWPRIYRVDYGHEEAEARQGKDPREYAILSKRFIGDDSGKLTGVETVQIQWDKDDKGEWAMHEIEGSKKVWDADLVFLSMGFTGPETPVTQSLGLDLDGRSNIRADRANYRTSVGRVFAAGDCRRGQSLVVHAIAEGRQTAREVDRYLQKYTFLP